MNRGVPAAHLSKDVLPPPQLKVCFQRAAEPPAAGVEQEAVVRLPHDHLHAWGCSM